VSPIEKSWLNGQAIAIRELASRSDILDVARLDERTFLLRYDARCLVALAGGKIVEHRGFLAASHLHDGYQHKPHPALVLTLVEPAPCFSPNVSAPLLCIGPILAGTPLVELARRAFEVVTLQNVGSSERDALNPKACRWVRANFDRLPIDSRPLEWRAADDAPAEHSR
jgi:hypothetical protein